ncbi:MAG: ABC transporter ATP-binding protein [Planctomycetota bacterium]
MSKIPMSENVIDARGLTKFFGDKCAVDRLDLQVPRGCVFGFLGRNGSGKSTTLRMLLGLEEPTRGEAEVLGHDCRRLPPSLRERIGYMPEAHPAYGWMTVAQFARFQSQFYPHWNAKLFDAVIDHFSLAPAARANNLSRGERAGLCLAAVIAPEPELLILDDPALGLDPFARRALLEAMVQLTRNRERTIVFSSHLLADVERVADEIAILDHSVLRARCRLDTFRERVKSYVLRFDEKAPPVPEFPGLLRAIRTEREVRLTAVNAHNDVRGAIAGLPSAGVEELEIPLEEAFIDYLGRQGERTMLLAEESDGGEEDRL